MKFLFLFFAIFFIKCFVERWTWSHIHSVWGLLLAFFLGGVTAGDPRGLHMHWFSAGGNLP